MNRDKMLAMLSDWKSLGWKEFGDGVVTIGGNPNVFPQRWVHTLHPALPKNILEESTKHFEILKKFEYHVTLQSLNGIKLFNDALYLFGCYSDYRTAEAPGIVLDIYYHNLDYFDKFGEPYNGIVIGGAHFGSREVMYTQTREGKILSLDFEKVHVLFVWDCFDAFIASEICRLNKLADFSLEFEPSDSWAAYGE